MASQLKLAQLHIRLDNKGMIKTDQDLANIAPFSFKTYFSWGMKKAYANWVVGETVTGSIVARIQGNVMTSQLENRTGTSKKIRSIEDSIMGDGIVNSKVIWADETNFLGVSCFGREGYSGWFLFSTSRVMSSTTEKLVLKKISRLGFNPKNYVRMPN